MQRDGLAKGKAYPNCGYSQAKMITPQRSLLWGLRDSNSISGTPTSRSYTGEIRLQNNWLWKPMRKLRKVRKLQGLEKPTLKCLMCKFTKPLKSVSFHFSSVQLLSHVWLFATPWIAARQASLSITNSRSSLKLMSIELVMPSSHLILCCPLLLLPPIPPSIRIFSNESTLRMMWPKYWSFSFSNIPSKEHPKQKTQKTKSTHAENMIWKLVNKILIIQKSALLNLLLIVTTMLKNCHLCQQYYYLCQWPQISLHSLLHWSNAQRNDTLYACS